MPVSTSRSSRSSTPRSHSGAAEGGINAPLGNAEDDPELQALDTVKGSDYLGDQDAIEILCDEAAADVYQLEHWGAVFSRTDDGRIAQRPFGAAGAHRTAYAADITGHVLIHVLYEQVVKRGIRVYEEFFAWKLVEDGGRCAGVIAWNLLDGGLVGLVGAKAVILATGGPGRLYVGTTNAYACTGDGMAMALRVGVPLKDMEMMQFHPTTLAPTGVLITEGCRGEGAFLLNADGERFLEGLCAARDGARLARRDLARRADRDRRGPRRSTATCCSTCATSAPSGSSSGCTGRASCRWCSRASTRSTSRSRSGPAPTTTWAASTRTSGAAPTLDGLYAAGEVACVSVHGANRLGGNALMETITFGRRAGADAAEYALSHTTRRGAERAGATPTPSCARCSTGATASGRGGSATSSP